MTTNPSNIRIRGNSFATAVVRNPRLASRVHDQPAWSALIAAVPRADAALAELPNRLASVATDPIREVDRALRQGLALPEGFGNAHAEAEAQRKAIEAESAILERLRQNYHNELAQLADESTAEMLEGLDEDLQHIITAAAPHVERLGGSADAAAAIKAKAVDAFEAIEALHAEYLEVRRLSDVVLRRQDDSLANSAPLHRLISNLDSIWPAWHLHRIESDQAGWDRLDGAPFPNDAEKLDFFSWIVANRETAAPRVLSADEIRRLRAPGIQAANEEYQRRHSPGTPSRPRAEGQEALRAAFNIPRLTRP